MTEQTKESVSMANFIEVICPFCEEGDFDAYGLKLHLQNGWCSPYDRLDGRQRCTDVECCNYKQPINPKSCLCIKDEPARHEGAKL